MPRSAMAARATMGRLVLFLATLARSDAVEAIDVAGGDADAREGARLRVGPRPAAMQRRPLIPDQDIADPPAVRVDRAGARRERDQRGDERLTLGLRQTDHGEGV